ncbi:MAG TPA: bifunctional salicylyl-CoA 5-hydroxylase/oxidoreductase [Acetobacteraceae bacterium]|nr:bifunctional salicylyl-CoA 5-hydroxylase/oxidoreductase [Acetobacteraceae bacterium]
MRRVMRVAVLGGGPAGLYFSILMKKAWPATEITVYERNRADDTFGFGVVFSDQTLETFEKYDVPSYRTITENFAYWDDIEIRFKGTVHRIGGNGFCGCSRATLLRLLQERARALGVRMQFQSEQNDIAAFADADLIVAADGINSIVRQTYAAHFRPEVDLRPNRFAWMGSDKPLDAFIFSFRETKQGVFIAHTYQYEQGRSTWVMETTADCYERSGLAQMSEAESARFLESVFAEDLEGHKLITNRSLWRQFPMIRNQRWLKNNVVLLGDAKSTAHFSIGSGTKLAMEDAIALFESFQANTSVAGALAHFENGRREEVERLQHAADVSLVWFEHVRRYWNMDPTQFTFGLMTRSKSITYDNLRLRAPEFVEETDRMFARHVRAQGFDVDAERPLPPMFQPLALRRMVVPNRVVVSPMCMYSATDGMPDDFHMVHYGARGLGGAGLMFTEMTCVAPDARITPGCAGLWNDEQEAAWTRIVDFVHARGQTKFCLQLGHAGRKGATRLMWDAMDRPLQDGAWPVMSASPIPYFSESQVPREVTRADMDRVREEFVASATRGLRCGFDMLELHSAHGYLLASFISPLTNKRTDAYGGDLDNRLRFPLEVFEALRAVWPSDKPMSVRISATDWADGGITGEDAVEIGRAFARAGCDLIDVSTGQTSEDSRPIYGRMFQTPFSDQIRNDASLATMCVGNITSADQVNTIVAAGRADLVALGRPHLADPYFTLHAAAQYGVQLLPFPIQYEPGKSQLFRLADQQRAEMLELRLKAKPKQHAPALVRAAE